VPRRIWLVDDTPRWHAVTARTLALVPGWRLESFHTAHAAVLAFQHASGGDGANLPQVVLMDFYLGHQRGDDVTETLRELEPAGHHAIIVGHSSMAHGSELIEMAGGDCRVRKHADGAGINPSLLDWLEGLPSGQG